MDPKHASLLKKFIRMIDYMRADLVMMLGQPPENPATAPAPTEKPTPLYEMFDKVQAAKAAAPITDGFGQHVPECPCWGCLSQRSPEFRNVKLTKTEVGEVLRGELNPFEIPFRDKALPPPPTMVEVTGTDGGQEFARADDPKLVWGPLIGDDPKDMLEQVLSEIAVGFPDQVEGLPMAYFHLDGEDGPRFTYDSVLSGPPASTTARDAIETWRRKIHEYLRDKKGTIHWRFRPEYEAAHPFDNPVIPKVHNVYSRLVVVPPQPEVTAEAVDPFEPAPSVIFTVDNEPAPPAPQITEYERLKREIHAQHGTGYGGQVCVKEFAPAHIKCTCPNCRVSA